MHIRIKKDEQFLCPLACQGKKQKKIHECSMSDGIGVKEASNSLGRERNMHH